VDIQLQDGVLSINVDGATLASTAMTSPLADQGAHDLVFGNLWGDNNFEGVVSALDITVNASHFAETDIVITPPQPRAGPGTFAPPELIAELPRLSEAPEFTSSDGVNLGGRGVALNIDREDISDILGRSDFSLSMELTAHSPESMGEVMRLHQSFVSSVDASGELSFLAVTQDGDHVRLTTNGANLNDLTPHEIEISLSNARLEITIDGNVLAATEMTSPLADLGNHDMTFGNPWGRDNFDGVVSGLSITVNESNFATSSTFDNLLEASAPGRDGIPEAEIIMGSNPASAADAQHAGLPISGAHRSNGSEDWVGHLESQMLNSSEHNIG
jgi:hypothetical protein